jgi:hypothetical protein
LHLRVQWEAFPQVLCQGLGSYRIARHGKRKRGFAFGTLTRGSKLQDLCRYLPSFLRIAVSGSLKSSIRQIVRAAFFVVLSYCGVNSPLGQFPRLAKATNKSLSIGCERKALVLVIGLARKPLLLFRHRGRIRAEEGKNVKIIVDSAAIHVAYLRLMDDLLRFVKPLHGKGVAGEIVVYSLSFRCKTQGSLRDLYGLFKLSLFGED